MSAIVRPAMTGDEKGICTLLHTKMNSRIPIARWRQLMTYAWLDDKPDFGRVVEADGQILGYCGMVYADRWIADGKSLCKERIVSMSSWYLDKSLRGQGLGKAMLVSAVEDPDLTYVTLTNSSKPLAIVESIGFKVLEDHRYLWRKTEQRDSRGSDVAILDDISAIRARIEPYQHEMIDDMHAFPLRPILVESGGAQSLLFLSVKHKDADVLWFDVMYVSNPSGFVNCAQVLADTLLPNTPAVLAVDGRLIGSQPTDAMREQLPVGRYYYGERVAPNDIDNLYSELQLLDLKLD